MTEEWLEFIVSCRNGESHQYDIVEGPMADGQIYNVINKIGKEKTNRLYRY